MNSSVLTLDYIKSKIAPIARKYGVDEIYVFGSYARGEATSNSDVDLLVFGKCICTRGRDQTYP